MVQLHFGVKQLKIGKTTGVLYSFVWNFVKYTNMKSFRRDSHILYIVRWSFTVVELNFNSLENFHGLMVVLHGQGLLHKLFHWKSFVVLIDPQKLRNFSTSNNLQYMVYFLPEYDYPALPC